MSSQRRERLTYALETLAVSLALCICVEAGISGAYASAQTATIGERLTRIDGDMQRLADHDTTQSQRVKAMERRIDKMSTAIDEMKDLAAKTQGMVMMLSLLSGLCAFALLIKAIFSRGTSKPR